jgi:hypothetical protein
MKGILKQYGSSSVIDLSFLLFLIMEKNEITGYLQNLKFQRTDSDSIE